jgi:hypothetical protein
MGNTFGGERRNDVERRERSQRPSQRMGNSHDSTRSSRNESKAQKARELEAKISQRLAQAREVPLAPTVISDGTDICVVECPICFGDYKVINDVECCQHTICTSCYFEVLTNSLYSPEGESCPFCNKLSFKASYSVKNTDENGSILSSPLHVPSSSSKSESVITSTPRSSIKDRMELEQSISKQRDIRNPYNLDIGHRYGEDEPRRRSRTSSGRYISDSDIGSSSPHRSSRRASNSGDNNIEYSGGNFIGGNIGSFEDMNEIMLMEALRQSIIEEERRKSVAINEDARPKENPENEAARRIAYLKCKDPSQMTDDEHMELAIALSVEDSEEHDQKKEKEEQEGVKEKEVMKEKEVDVEAEAEAEAEMEGGKGKGKGKEKEKVDDSERREDELLAPTLVSTRHPNLIPSSATKEDNAGIDTKSLEKSAVSAESALVPPLVPAPSEDESMVSSGDTGEGSLEKSAVSAESALVPPLVPAPSEDESMVSSGDTGEGSLEKSAVSAESALVPPLVPAPSEDESMVSSGDTGEGMKMMVERNVENSESESMDMSAAHKKDENVDIDVKDGADETASEEMSKKEGKKD